MPAIRSFFSATLMAACLAQVMAGGEGGGQGGWGGEGGQGGGSPPRFDGGGGGQGDYKDNNYQTSQWQDWQPSHVQPPPVAQCEPTFVTKHIEVTKVVEVTKPVEVTKNMEVTKIVEKPVTVTVTFTKDGEKQISTVIKDGGKATITESKTITVTAAAPCTSVATAIVTQWQNAPPGCWCGGGSPPPSWQGQWPPSNAAVVGNILPGLSSIPASEALKTGVTVAGPGPAPAPTGAPGPPPAGGPPGAGFGSSSSAK